MALHSAAVSTSLHVLHAFTYADASARTSATGLVAADVGKISKQTDTSRFYILTNHSPVTWSEISAPSNGGGGINYVTNPNGEDSTAGWVTYADAAGTSPVDGTGGSPTVTLTRSTSSPLRGTANFLFTKDAANRQGQGASYDFTVDRADLSKVLEVTVDFEPTTGFTASSGAVGSDSDIEFFLYDVTNAALIPISPNKITSGVGIQQTFRGTFQSASNSSSYRLIMHVATVSATAYTLKFDNVRVGPPSTSQGTPVTDWESFTPTGSWSTNTTYTGFKRRVGDTLEVMVKLTLSGAPTSATLLINNPTGLTTDTAKLFALNAGENLGDAQINDTGIEQYFGQVVYDTSTTVKITLNKITSVYLVNSPQLTQAIPLTFGNTDTILVRYRVPIVGWSSNVQMSSEADTRVVAAKYTGTPTGTIGAAFNTITFPTKSFDTHESYSSGTYTTPVSGIYSVSASVEVSGTETLDQQLNIAVYVDGVVAAYLDVKRAVASTTSTSVTGTSLIKVNAGQLVTIKVYTEIGSPSYTSVALVPSFSIHRLSGPNQIASTEDVGARYTTNIAQSMTNNSATRIDYEDKDYDTHGAVTTGASWVFTTPVAGTYLISAQGKLTGCTANTGEHGTLIYKNGVEIFNHYRDIAFSTESFSQATSAVKLLAGDTISVFTQQNNGVARSLQSGVNGTLSNFISINRISN